MTQRRSAVAITTVLAACALFASASCNAVRQQKSVAPVPDSGLFRNLQVLTPNMTRQQLVDVMRGFSNALNVHCDHCHVSLPPDDEREFDFASDAKPAKDIARTMIRMTRVINADYVQNVSPSGGTVTCMTCHRGNPIPDPQQAPR